MSKEKQQPERERVTHVAKPDGVFVNGELVTPPSAPPEQPVKETTDGE